MKKVRDQMIGVQVTSEVKISLIREAERRGMSVSMLVFRILEDYINERGIMITTDLLEELKID